MGPQLEYLETILTCKGNFYAPDFSSHLDDLKCRLQELVFSDDDKKLVVKKVEPWNSVRVTLKMPVDAAHKLKKLAEQRDRLLHEIGVLEVQIEGDKVISLAVDGSKSENLQQLPENARKLQNLVETPSCCSGQCVPSRETLNPFASLPQSANIEWPLFTKILNSIGERSTNVSHSVTDLHFGCLQTCQKYSNAIVTSSFPCENSTNGVESSKVIQNASSSPFELNSTLGSRSWSAGEEKLINCQNIASSSPLLVNLLKSPSSRNQMNGTSFSTHVNSELSSEMAMPAQKRRRSQTRKSKRLKEECDDLLSENSHLGIPRSFATFRQDEIGASSPNVSCQIASEPRQMINPYTGDLEVIEECEEPSNSSSSDSITHSKDSNPYDSLSASVTNMILVKTLESRTTHTSDLSVSEKFASSHSSKILPSSHNGSLTQSPTSDASSDILLRSNSETSTSDILNSKIPVYNLQSSIAASYQNINIPHSVGSSIPNSHTENTLLLNHTLSTCYMQNMLKALSSESAAKFFASQSLVLPSSSEHVQEETKSFIDANTLAKIIVQSSLLPKSLDPMKNACPGETRPYSHPGSALLNSNAQLTKQLAGNPKFSPFPVNVVPQDGKLPAYINVPLKEGASVQQMSKRLLETQTFQKLTKLNSVVSCTQASQLMKDMFPSLSLPVFSAGASIPTTSATYNGHVDVSRHDHLVGKTSQTDFLKNSLYSSDCRSINGCYSSALGQISFVNEKLSSAALLASSASATLSSDCDGSLTTPFGPSKSLPCRKPSKNADDILPTKSKANLTVAQLLEQVEIAKNHLAYSASQKNNTTESPLSNMSSSGVASTKSCNAKSEQRNETVSHVQKNTLASQNNFGRPHNLSTCMNSIPFNVLDSVPMPITSPGYPHNLTESVQKAMRGVGFDNSPSASPLPSKQADAMLHHQTNAVKDSQAHKVSNIHSSVSTSKEDSVSLPDLDILENQFEFRQLEEALKCTLKNQEHGEQSNAASQKNLIDLDSTDLDFVFNAEDESHLESIIALRDYDDIEKLAETLASNIDDGDIDEILINEKDLESLDQGNNIYKTSKSNCSQALVNPEVCTSVDSDIIQIASSLLNSNSNNQQPKEDITKTDFNTELSKTKLLEGSMCKAKVSETVTDHIHSEAFVERNQCKSPIISKKPMDMATPQKNHGFIDETVSHSTSNRMATRSSNKQKSSISNFQNDSIFEASTPVMSKDIAKNTSEEATLQPSLRRSNRTIRKTELAFESFPAKSIERSKKAKLEGIDKLPALPSVKSEIGPKVFRQKSTMKRKHSSRIGSINENIHTATEVQKDQNSLKRVGNSSSSIMNDSAITEPDFLYNKRPKTS